MIRVKTCFVAEGVVVDRDSNQATAYSIIEDLLTPSYPLFLQKIAFFSRWDRTSSDPAQCRAEFSLTHDGQDLSRQFIDFDFGESLRTRCTIRLDGLSLARPGTVVFRLAIPGHEAAEYAIHAETTPSTSPGTVGPTGPSRIYDSGQVSISVGTVNVHRR